LSYLRFTPDEYRTIAGLCRRLRLGRQHRPGFKRLLVQALASVAPELGKRLARLRRSELGLLYNQFQERIGPGPGASANTGPRHDFTPAELQTVLDACVTPPSPVRFVRPFKHVLVELFAESAPELAQKLAHMSGHQFERLYEQACEQQRRGSA